MSGIFLRRLVRFLTSGGMCDSFLETVLGLVGRGSLVRAIIDPGNGFKLKNILQLPWPFYPFSNGLDHDATPDLDVDQ